MRRDDARLAWERWPGESAKAFAAFTMYRDAGPTRSVTNVAAGLSKSRSLLSRWSSRWNWADRCAAYDDHLEAVKLATAKATVAAIAEQHCRLLAASRSVVSILPRAALECLADPSQLAGIIAAAKKTPAGLLRLLELTVPFLRTIPDLIATERIAHGLNTVIEIDDRRETSVGDLIPTSAAATALAIELFHELVGVGAEAAERIPDNVGRPRLVTTK